MCGVTVQDHTERQVSRSIHEDWQQRMICHQTTRDVLSCANKAKLLMWQLTALHM